MPVVSDDFNGTDGTVLPTYNANWSRNVGTGTAQITGDGAKRARRNGTSSQGAFYKRSEAPASTDYYAQALFVWKQNSSTFFACAVVRIQATESFLYIRHYNGNWQAFKAISGTYTQIGSNSAETINSGATRTVRITVSGVSPNIAIDCTSDGVSKVNVTGINETTLDPKGLGGIGFQDIGQTASDTNGVHIDDFLIEDTVTTGKIFRFTLLGVS